MLKKKGREGVKREVKHLRQERENGGGEVNLKGDCSS